MIYFAHGHCGITLYFSLSIYTFYISLLSYLFNPFTIATCGGYSTLLLTNLSIVFALWMKLRGVLVVMAIVWMMSAMLHSHLGSDLLSALGLALAVNFSLYPVMLVCPLVLMAYKVINMLVGQCVLLHMGH